MYFDCNDVTDPLNPIKYIRENQDIEYTIASNQDLKVNTQAGEDGILSTAIGRDIYEKLIKALDQTINHIIITISILDYFSA